jgi:hypothetical protein
MPTLDWLNRADAFTTAARVPYRLLEQASVHSATAVTPSPRREESLPGACPRLDRGARSGGGGEGLHDNLLIQGDNLEALKALLPFYRGQVKCIFIDPPYNTQSAFEHYDDNLEHSQWLSMMLPRLQLLRELLREDGSIWVTIDDNEGHYLKVMMDEVFGRRNFVATNVWQKRYSRDNNSAIGDVHDYVLCYAKATNPGDLVLDSFLGSGTTAAVAHKMGRRWIGIEMGEHAATHCLPRLQKVIDGEQGGISAAVGWQGGGGFRFMRLGAPIFDADGCIHPEVRFATLAAFVWQQETGTARTPGQGAAGTPWLGTHYDIDSAPWPSDAGKEPISPENSPPDLFSAPPEPAPDATLVAGATPQAPRPVKAVYLLFNGILGDRRPAGGNVLTVAVLDALLAQHATTPAPEAPLVVYGEACRLGPARLALAHVTFRHIPYDVKAR